MRVQVVRGCQGSAHDRDPALGEVTAHHRLEADVVARVGVRDVELAVGRADGHVEEHRPDAGHDPRRRRRGGVGVEHEHVVVRQREGHRRAPVAADLVLPVAGRRVEPHDEAGARGAGRRAGRRRRQSAVRAHHLLGDRRGAVAGVEHRRVHDRAVGTRRQRPRLVAEELHDRERCIPGSVGVEDPHVGTADAGRGELRPAGRVGGEAVLSAPRRGDEGAGMAAAREDDVARLVADPQRARDAGARHVRRVDLDDADAVGEVIHHPDLGLPGEVRARGDRHRLEADRDLRRERKPACADRVDRQAIVRRVQREEAVAARREREGADMPALEVGERPAAGGSRGHEKQDGGESTRDHVPFLLVRAPERYQRPSAVTITRCGRARRSRARATQPPAVLVHDHPPMPSPSSGV